MQVAYTVTGSSAPIVTVVGSSMEPTYYRGDLLLLTVPDRPYKPGEVVAFTSDGRDIPILHRVIEIKEDDGGIKMLTKGDNNTCDDRVHIYNPGQLWVEHKDVLGRVRGNLPYVGYLVIAINYFGSAKYVIVTCLVMVLITFKRQ